MCIFMLIYRVLSTLHLHYITAAVRVFFYRVLHVLFSLKVSKVSKCLFAPCLENRRCKKSVLTFFNIFKNKKKRVVNVFYIFLQRFYE